MENSQVYTAVVPPEREGERLDVFTAELADITRSRAGTLIRQGSAVVDGATQTKTGFKLKAGAAVRLEVPPATPVAVEAEDIALDILYQDDDLAVVFKPSGMVVHPAAGNESGTLAKNDFSHVALSEQIRAHTVKRAYRAIVIGGFREDAGTVEGPIGRHPTDRKRMAIVPGGRDATTHWTALEPLRGATLIEARLTTGRTHQIRVHMASIGHPVLGDPVYGPKKSPYLVEGGQLLHAFRLGFVHPRTGEEMLFEAKPEARFLYWLEKLRK